MENKLKFRRLGTMVDCSRNAVMNVAAIKRWIDVTSDLGYNVLGLYMEDTYEIQGEPYFGHQRGRYSQDELREIAVYAREKEMEVIPHIQTLAHLPQIFQWPDYTPLQDTADILLAGEQRAYQLIERMFEAIHSTMGCKTINIGMDEAMMLGKGKYYDKHGPEDRFHIFMSHLNRVSEIARKYHFELLIWGDMFFCPGNSESVKEQIPDNVTLVYWDYGFAEKKHYDSMIEAYAAVKENVAFAGGLWTWTGITPHNSYAISAAKAALESCSSHGIQDVYMTLWGDDGGECSRFAVLPALYFTAEYAKGNTDMDAIKRGFDAKFGIPFDEFLLLELSGTPGDSGTEVMNPDRYMLFNDCFLGKFDSRVQPGETESYAVCAQRLAKWKDHPEYGFLFRSQQALCEVLEMKYDLGVRTRQAYLENDRPELERLTQAYWETARRVEILYEAFRHQWMYENKPHGFDIQDIRFGGLLQRLRHCRLRVEEYLRGAINRIEELEEPVLENWEWVNKEGGHIRYTSWHKIVSANIL